jgi:hypothetical protein
MRLLYFGIEVFMTVQPMHGVRILEVAQFTFTPAAGAVLADRVPTSSRSSTPSVAMPSASSWARVRWPLFQPLMEQPNRGKRSMGLALEHPDGRLSMSSSPRAMCSSPTFCRTPQAAYRCRRRPARQSSIIYARGSAFDSVTGGGRRRLRPQRL